MSLKDWIITLLIIAIPVVNIIMLFVWAFGSGNNLTRQTFAKAYLIWLVIIIVVAMLLSVLFGTALFMGSQAGGWS